MSWQSSGMSRIRWLFLLGGPTRKKAISNFEPLFHHCCAASSPILSSVEPLFMLCNARSLFTRAMFLTEGQWCDCDLKQNIIGVGKHQNHSLFVLINQSINGFNCMESILFYPETTVTKPNVVMWGKCVSLAITLVV